jgi:hypothetical protein
MGRRGRERAVARFGTESHVEAVLSAYDAALGGAPPARSH